MDCPEYGTCHDAEWCQLGGPCADAVPFGDLVLTGVPTCDRLCHMDEYEFQQALMANELPDRMCHESPGCDEDTCVCGPTDQPDPCLSHKKDPAT